VPTTTQHDGRKNSVSEIYIGIDGGGTHTRALAVDRTGRTLARAETGGANQSDTSDAEQNVLSVIREVVAGANRELSDVAGLVAGLAGVNNNTESQARGERFVAVEGLSCPPVVVNDAVVAHVGGLRSRPGIIAIGGTGSIVFGVNEAGTHLRNYDASHFGGIRASFLAYDAVHRVLAGDGVEDDEMLTREIYAYWEVSSLEQLRESSAVWYQEDRQERDYRFGAMAQLVTEGATAGSPVAKAACDAASEGLCTGIRIVGARFSGTDIDVVLIGGVARSPYLQKAIAGCLQGDREHRYTIVEPAFTPEIGAAIMALENDGIRIDDTVLSLAPDQSEMPQES
jgi:glucosamine kinase